MSPEDKTNYLLQKFARLIRQHEPAKKYFIEIPSAGPATIRVVKDVLTEVEESRTIPVPDEALPEPKPAASEPEPEPENESAAEPDEDDDHFRVAKPHRVEKGPRLTRRQAAEIKEKIARGERNCSLADYYKCSNELISCIRHGRTWRSA
jgi:hypothetical protein